MSYVGWNSAWRQQTAWYIDPVAGSDIASGLAGAPIKTLAALMQRVTSPDGDGQWNLSQNVDVYFASYPPVTDPLRLDVKFVPSSVGAGPVLTFHPPPYVQASAGVFSAIAAHVQGGNVPWSVTDGIVAAGGDVAKRIRIAAGVRAGASTWVASSPGVGQRRTGTWASWAMPPTTLPAVVTPQVGDPYVVESSSANLYVDFINVEAAGGIPGPNTPMLVLNGLDFAPIRVNGTIGIRNAGCTMWILSCGFWSCEVKVKTVQMAGDFGDGYTYFQNCAAGLGMSNVTFMEGTFIENYWFGGVVGGSLWARNGGGATVDYDVLAQQGFGAAGSVAGYFVSEFGSLALASAGVMDGHSNFGSVIIGDGVLGMQSGFAYSGNVGLWGTSTNANNVGVDVRAGGTFRYESGTNVTITGAGGDFRLAGSAVARSWDDVAGAYTANVACAWANLVGGALKDNAHSLSQNAHAYKNPPGMSQAQP